MQKIWFTMIVIMAAILKNANSGTLPKEIFGQLLFLSNTCRNDFKFAKKPFEVILLNLRYLMTGRTSGPTHAVIGRCSLN